MLICSFHSTQTSYYPEFYQISDLLFSGVNGKFLSDFINITDTLITYGYTRRDILIIPIWEMREIIKIKNNKNHNDREYLVK